jgi:hypothetical protein
MTQYETTYDIMAGGFSSVDLEVAVEVSLVDDALCVGDVSLFVQSQKAYLPCEDDVLARRIQDFILDDEAEYEAARRAVREGPKPSPFSAFVSAYGAANRVAAQ